MFEQDVKRFAKIMIVTGEIYRKPFTSAAIEMYWNILKVYTIKEVEDAFKNHTENIDVGKFLPTPADIIMAIKGNSQNQALLAWTKVDLAIRTVGRYSSVAFDDFLIHKVIEDMGNWKKLCCVKEEEMPFIKKEFLERYRGYVVKNPSNYPKYLVGIIENQNSTYGYIYDPPTLIGNTEKAKKVIAAGQRSILVKELLLPERTNKSVCNN